MSVISLPRTGSITTEQTRAFKEADAAIVAAVHAAKEAGVMQGLIVALLCGHAHQQTAAMMDQS